MPRVIACRTAKPSNAKAMSRLAASSAETARRARSGRNGAGDRGRRAAPALDGGKRIAGRSGHGRLSRPEIFTMRAGEPEVEHAGKRGRARRLPAEPPATSTSMRSGSASFGRIALVGLAQSRPARGCAWSVPKLGQRDGDHQRAEAAAHRTSRPTGYHSSAPPPPLVGRAREQGQDSRATRRPNAITGTAKKNTPERSATDRRGDGRGDQPGPMAPAERGDQDRQRREIEQEDCGDRSGDDGCKQQRARPRPRPSPTQNDLYHPSCPASSAVRDGSTSVPTIGERDDGRRRSVVGRSCVVPGGGSSSVSGSRRAAGRGSARA